MHWVVGVSKQCGLKGRLQASGPRAPQINPASSCHADLSQISPGFKQIATHHPQLPFSPLRATFELHFLPEPVSSSPATRTPLSASIRVSSVPPRVNSITEPELSHHALGSAERRLIDGTFGSTTEANLLESFTGLRGLVALGLPRDPGFRSTLKLPAPAASPLRIAAGVRTCRGHAACEADT
ncbi:hypothetical protein SKAU_G00314380 [Synaphobranchus kaupii]|uniref:Uncharacterized protein n=1 Tax=Synaphobranchus kaupii TaxID=118154 RepID=A0A9Q1IJG6_SYNKA|nr:hypothetical protein SKAU_G00314380 [Synaphobranchus kaupii]